MKRKTTLSRDGSPPDSYLLFLKWLITSTREQHLHWDAKPNVFTTDTRSMRAEFETETSTHGNQTWSLFTVKDARAVLFRVAPGTTISKIPLDVVRLVDTLFAAVLNYSGRARKHSVGR
jgi:hypothetical protein